MAPSLSDNEVLKLLIEIKSDLAAIAVKVGALEKYNDEQGRREWIKAAIVVPVIAVLHAGVRRLGFDV